MTPNPAPVTTSAEDAREIDPALQKLIDSAPAHIWLDLGEETHLVDEGTTFRDLAGVTWSEDNATGVGIKYVRAPAAVTSGDAGRAAFLDHWVADVPKEYRAAARERASQDLLLDIGRGPLRIAADAWQASAARVSALPIDFKQATDQGGWQLYVECRECSNCGHVGINDDAKGMAACNSCDWNGPSPKEDHCPQCERDGTMSGSCPECGHRTTLIADARLAAPGAAIDAREQEAKCPGCAGSGADGDVDDYGHTIDVRCGRCNGSGKARDAGLPWPWKTEQEVLLDAVTYLQHQPRLAEAVRILASRPEAPPASASPATVAQPMFYASAEQANALEDRPGDPEGGRYLPVRKTAAGKFTMPLYAAQPCASQGCALDAQRYRALRSEAERDYVEFDDRMFEAAEDLDVAVDALSTAKSGGA